MGGGVLRALGLIVNGVSGLYHCVYFELNIQTECGRGHQEQGWGGVGGIWNGGIKRAKSSIQLVQPPE